MTKSPQLNKQTKSEPEYIKVGFFKVKKGLPWYHYRSVWLILIIIPVLTLIASISMVYTAATSNLAGGAHESYYKKGLSPNELAPREEEAKKMGLSAKLSVQEKQILIDFNKPLNTDNLIMKFQHPTLESKDFSLPLQAIGSDKQHFFIAVPENLRKNKWDIFIDPSTDNWRVKGRLLERENAIDLTPFGQ
ncbi:MAG: FixH family protein [Gammaproteobacteria bacterium]|nr:FixH family protein [Gammaproteobacteria bacterium]